MAAVGSRIDAPERRFDLGRELADDFLEDVFERHETLEIAVFVDDESDAPPQAAKTQQLVVERRSFGREERLAAHGNVAQAIARQAASRQLVGDEAHVDDSLHAVESRRRRAASAYARSRAGGC